jgi:cold shock CspA family protein
MQNELHGTITFLKNNYGFITAQDEPTQYFFHFSNFKTGQRPVLGASVRFRLGQPIRLGQKVQAIGVRPANPSLEDVMSALGGSR